MKELTREEKRAVLEYIDTLRSWISFCPPPVSVVCQAGLHKLKEEK